MQIDVLLIDRLSTEETPSVPHEVGEPIRLCYLAAPLRAQGITAEVLDGFTLGLSSSQLVELTRAYHLQVCVGISVLETSALASARYVRELRRSGFRAHICAGNYYPTLNPERTFALDSIAKREMETSLQVADFGDLIEELMAGLRAGRVGLRPEDLLPNSKCAAEIGSSK